MAKIYEDSSKKSMTKHQLDFHVFLEGAFQTEINMVVANTHFLLIFSSVILILDDGKLTLHSIEEEYNITEAAATTLPHCPSNYSCPKCSCKLC